VQNFKARIHFLAEFCNTSEKYYSLPRIPPRVFGDERGGGDRGIFRCTSSKYPYPPRDLLGVVAHNRQGEIREDMSRKLIGCTGREWATATRGKGTGPL